MGELGSMSIIEHMSDGYPQVDRILVAQLTGEARFHVRWRELSADEQAAAVVALRELANGWADLLAQVAGSLRAHPRASWMSCSPARAPHCARPLARTRG
jgi:hypothetical protein